MKNQPKDETSLYERDRRAKEVLRRTKDPKAAVQAYCKGNRWLTENAKSVGNLPE